jgi:hypothetical protein
MDKFFVKVRDYLDDHPKAGIDIVSEETGVSKKAIMYLIKEGRIIINEGDDSDVVLICEVCKKPIATGRICSTCKSNLATMIDKKAGSKPSGASTSSEAQNFKGSAKISS